MPSHPTPTPTADHTEYYRHILHQMIELGADLAHRVHAQAKAHTETETPIPPDLTVAFDRTVRAVRRTILLARSLDAPPRPQQAPDRQATRRRIIRAVEDAIHMHADPAEADTLHAEFQDRLDAPEFEDDIAGRPITEIIGEIRDDLGLDPMPGAERPRRTPADIAALHARAAATSIPRHRGPPPGPGTAPLPFRPRHPNPRH